MRVIVINYANEAVDVVEVPDGTSHKQAQAAADIIRDGIGGTCEVGVYSVTQPCDFKELKAVCKSIVDEQK